MSTQKHPIIRWTTLKGLTTVILFLIAAVLIEYIVVFYAVNLGVNDTPSQWNFQFPGTTWTITISPLFHLVPIAVIIALTFTWIYLTKHVTLKPHEIDRGKGGVHLTKEAGSFSGKIKSKLLGVTIKSALIVFLIFLTFSFIVSLVVYPKLIHQTISNAYQNNPSLLNAVKSVAQALAPLSAINNALLFAAPSFRAFIESLGAVAKPLTELDPAVKYLVFQNVAAWASALSALLYREYARKGYRYKKRKG